MQFSRFLCVVGFVGPRACAPPTHIARPAETMTAIPPFAGFGACAAASAVRPLFAFIPIDAICPRPDIYKDKRQPRRLGLSGILPLAGGGGRARGGSGERVQGCIVGHAFPTACQPPDPTLSIPSEDGGGASLRGAVNPKCRRR